MSHCLVISYINMILMNLVPLLTPVTYSGFTRTQLYTICLVKYYTLEPTHHQSHCQCHHVTLSVSYQLIQFYANVWKLPLCMLQVHSSLWACISYRYDSREEIVSYHARFISVHILFLRVSLFHPDLPFFSQLCTLHLFVCLTETIMQFVSWKINYLIHLFQVVREGYHY